MIPQYESTGEWVQRIEEQKHSQPSKKQCKHENLLVVPSNGKRICEDCGYIIFKKSSEPAKKPTDHNNFEPGQELEFDVNNRVIKGKFIRYDLKDEEKILIETTYDMLYEHGLNSNAPGSVQRVHKSWLVEKKKPTGILKDLSELKRYYIAMNGENYDMAESEIGAFVEHSDVEAIINKYLNQ